MKLKTPILKSSRLILRKFNPRDSNDLIELDLSSRKIGKINNTKNAKIWIKNSIYDNKEGFYLAVVLKQENKVIGYAELCHLGWFHQKEAGEICYHISKKYRGKGYATEASRLLISYCFNKLKFRKIYADTDPDNFASQKVLKKLGFELEGTIREKHFVKGKWIDELDFGLLKSEWKK